MPSSSSSSSASESSSDSGNAEIRSTPPSSKQQQNRNPSEPSSSKTMKRPREPQEKGASNPSSKKSKKPAQGDSKGKAAEVLELADKSVVKKGAAVWNLKDETAFLKTLLACCEKGKGKPKSLSAFYEAVKKNLSGEYSNDQLYTKFRGLRTKFKAARKKFKDEGFRGFKSAREESLYKLSIQIWGAKEDEEVFGTEKAGEGGDATEGKKKKKKKKKKNVVANADPSREKEDANMKMNKNGDAYMALKEQEGEGEGEGEEREEEEEEEEGVGLDQGEQNVNENLSQHETEEEEEEEGVSHITENVLKRVEEERRKGEVGEEEDESEESDESESSDDENPVPRDSNAALKQPNVGESLRQPLQNGRMIAQTNLENLGQNGPDGIANGSPTDEQYQMFQRLFKESIGIAGSEIQGMLEGFKNEIVNFVNAEKRRATGFEFSVSNAISSRRELPLLSEKEAEMLDHKWQKQQLIEMEAASKHLALLQEECQLRMAKFRPQ